MDQPTINGWCYIIGTFITVGIPGGITLILSLRSHRTLTKNHHESKKPTVPDRLDNIEKALEVLLERESQGKHKK